MRKSLIHLIAFAIFAIQPHVAFGLASGSVVYDPTNWLQNAQTAASTARQYTEQLRSYLLQIQQYKTQVSQLQHMSSTDLALTVLRQTNNQTAMDAARSLQAIEKLRGSLSLMNNRYDSRLNQARLQNQTWGQYVTAEDSRIKRNVGEAKLQVIEDQRILSMVNRDYDFANAQAAKIPQTQGMHESLNQLNTQMNRVVVQNAEMIRLMARAQGNGSSEDRVQQAEKDAQKIRDADAEKAATEAQALRRKAAIDALGNYK